MGRWCCSWRSPPARSPSPCSRPAATRARAWLTAGLWLGLAGLSKYHAAFFALGAFGFVLATRHRRHLLTPWPWFAVVVAGLVAAPVFVWNAEHGFVSFLFQAGRGSAGTHIAIVPVLQALGGQAGYLLPWTMVGLAVALALACVGHRASERTRFLAALALPPIVLFTILPLWAGRGLPHWQMPGWLFAFPCSAFSSTGRPPPAGAGRHGSPPAPSRSGRW
ncbi:glycosyltransferase family 39 protein [Methyloraptor flagellatus]|uniref:Glycosyltransferase family 39 protein n=1 Tax=Methyloraptor flagellatus TaxID=3162530 RepID=A0AAU7XEI2_9HYPH